MAILRPSFPHAHFDSRQEHDYRRSNPNTDGGGPSAANPMEIGKGRGREHEPLAWESTPSYDPHQAIEMGTSPPFSMLAGMELRNGMFASKETSGLHWPWGGESKQESGETTPTQPNIVAPTPKPVPAHTRTSPPAQASSGPLMPPQRKKSHQHSHSLPNKVPTFSIGRTSSSSSISGSGSGSGSSSGSDTANGGRALAKNASFDASRPKLLSPQPWPLPPQGQLRRVMSPPPGLASRRIFEMNAEGDEAAAVNEPSASPSSPMEMPSPASPANDAVYQAFVRQWCFAQGPAPNVGAGSPGRSGGVGPLTPDVAVR
jgi:hypothetical protein